VDRFEEGGLRGPGGYVAVVVIDASTSGPVTDRWDLPSELPLKSQTIGIIKVGKFNKSSVPYKKLNRCRTDSSCTT
jgi:hypothetical protein